MTPSETARFTIPKEKLVMIVINTSPFNPANNIHVDEVKPEGKYDHEQYIRLAGLNVHEKASQSQLSAKLAQAATQVTAALAICTTNN